MKRPWWPLRPGDVVTLYPRCPMYGLNPLSRLGYGIVFAEHALYVGSQWRDVYVIHATTTHTHRITLNDVKEVHRDARLIFRSEWQ